MSQNLNFTVDGLAVQLPKARKDYLCQYPGREFPQGAYLQLRMSAEPPHLCATFNGEIGNAVPSDVYRGYTLRFDFPSEASLKDVRKCMNQIAPLCAELCASYRSDWDGNNIVGVSDPKLRDRIQDTIDNFFDIERY